jgi:hypothetical protein
VISRRADSQQKTDRLAGVATLLLMRVAQMVKVFIPKTVNFVRLVLGWLLARLGLALVEADELARLRAIPEPRPIPPGTKLIPVSFIGIDPLVVQRVGGDAAILLETVTFWLAANARKGRDDTYNSYPAWAGTLKQRTGIEWDKSKVGRLMRSLKEAELLAGHQPAPHKPTSYRKGEALKARDAELHRPDAVVQLPLTLVDRPGAKVDDILAVKTPHVISPKSSSPMPKAAAADAPAKAAAAAPVVCTVRDILDRETSDRSADRDRDLEGAAIRHARKPGPSPVPAAPSPRPDELTTELDAQAEPVPAAIAAVFAESVARTLIAQHGAETVAAMIADTLKRDGVKNLPGLVRLRLAQGDRVAVEKSYDDMTQEQKLRKWLGPAYDPAVHA